jgi:type 1 glutamine amidotransferase
MRAQLVFVLLLGCLGLFVDSNLAFAQQQPMTHVLIVVGPSDHPPGSHEVQAGARLMEHCLEQAQNVSGIEATVSYGWPTDQSLLDRTATIVFTGDRFPPMELPNSAEVMKQVGTMMNRGCGIVCVHYATGLGASHVGTDGAHPLLGWMGGYFATRCAHHQSIARIYESATINPGDMEHPVLQGWKPFTLKDEPYINNYFGPQGMAANVVPLAVSMLPPENPQREVVAWGVQRGDGGRGVGVVMPHFYRNWADDNLRMLTMNSILWTARREIPAEGVLTPQPDLARFQPESLVPMPRKPAR